jgi:hypothetical protein
VHQNNIKNTHKLIISARCATVLQHLVCIRDDAQTRPAYYKLIEECVSQIVLHKSGCDPDFRATQRFNIDVEPLIEQLVERGRMEDGASGNGSMGMTAGNLRGKCAYIILRGKCACTGILRCGAAHLSNWWTAATEAWA